MRAFATVIFLALSTVMAGAQDAPVLEANHAGTVSALNVRIDAATRNGPPVAWKTSLSRPNTNYMRLHLRREGPPAGPGTVLHVFDAQGGHGQIPLDGLSEEGRWTPLIPGGKATLALAVKSPLDPATTLVIDALLEQSQQVTLYSIHGNNDLVSVTDPSVSDDIRKLAAPIAFLTFFHFGQASTCTGFLVEPDLLVTNEHCIRSQENCDTMSAIFDYRQRPGGGTSMGPQFDCAGYSPKQSDFDLDVSAIRLTGTPGPDYGLIALTDPPPAPTGPLMILQHPGDEPLQVSLMDCRSEAIGVDGRAPGSDFTHTCDTASGSSGAPVLDLDGQFVGLHHFGFEEAPASAWNENRGVLGSLVVAWIAAQMTPATPDTAEGSK